ncbi:aldehyde dehydrogenase family protein [Nocardia sp. alder85J]|uniref:aldehyde dehydrogenase family protein n=1 Tax=Nocardia sp. alder85J TaxID=2862949 RepID=UPI001CD19A3D|nr:aldehyde dehydrogenase family protein [Nocardia sp. alder85J]MCX4092549.1 aldehyde dehydrogenase family protein [Nocardia sp. alder85J]
MKKLYIHYQPLGVVGVITPRSGEWVVKILHEAGVPPDVVQVVHGDGETGAALVAAEVDKVCFTGSVATGRKIAAACAERLLPCTLELGGKDAMIVCADADLERAAAGAVYLSMFNTGQVCMSVRIRSGPRTAACPTACTSRPWTA